MVRGFDWLDAATGCFTADEGGSLALSLPPPPNAQPPKFGSITSRFGAGAGEGAKDKRDGQTRGARLLYWWCLSLISA